MSTTPPETTADLAARLERFVKEQAARYGDVISYVPVAGAAAPQITKEVAPTAAKEAKPTKKTAAKAAEAPSEVLASVTAGGLDVLREKLAPHAAEPWMAATSLEVMEQSIQGCQRCALGATRNKLVFGSGNPKAKVLVIGEAPGADEDEQGFPFVGRAGQLLTKMLEAVQFDRTKDVYIANILKSRPPNNRDPKPEEVEQCEVYLWKQILLLEPKLILCLGRVAGTNLLKINETLGKMRGGVVHQFYGIPTLVTYHPAALLRNPDWKHGAWDDLKVLRKLYDELP